MNLRALMFLSFASFIAQPAFAQTAPVSVQATIDSLLASGYDVKAVNVMSDAAIKEVFTGQTGVTSQVFITLQKGNSVAVCLFSTQDWINLNGSITDPTRCTVR